MSRTLPLLLGLVGLACASAEATSLSRHTLTVGGRERIWHLHEPPTATSPRAAVLVLHGFRQDADDLRTLAGWEDLADEEGFLVVYPEGWKQSWNDGDDSKPATREDVDDTAFLLALLDELEAYDVDPDRIHAVGFSNGGFVLLRAACELRERLASVGIVAAGVHHLVDTFCDGGRALPARFVLGTEEPAVPWDGWRDHPATPGASGRIWARMNKCDPEPTRDTLPDAVEDGTVTHREDYTDCMDGADVSFLRIEGGGHTWPGGHQYLPSLMVGRTALRRIGGNDPCGRGSRRRGAPGSVDAEWVVGVEGPVGGDPRSSGITRHAGGTSVGAGAGVRGEGREW